MHSEHGRDTVPVLTGNEEWIFSDHEIPADGGVAGHIGPATF
jgi:hypothetical protein